MGKKELISLVFTGAAIAGLFVFADNFSTPNDKVKPGQPGPFGSPSQTTAQIKKKEPGKNVNIFFVGDIMLSRAVGEKIKKENNPKFPFLKIASTTRAADLVVGNLEGPISTRGTNQGSEYSFRADPEVVDGLVFAGIDVLSLANNHMFDWGRDGMSDTVMHLNKNGISTVGAGRTYAEANAPALKEVNGVRMAFLAYTDLYPSLLTAKGDIPGISLFGMDKARKDISQAKKDADMVVLIFHWGDEYELRSNERHRYIARALIDAGADLVIGHHPHVIQEIESYKGKWIAYSLGNFIFDQNFSKETMEGIMVKATVRNGELTDVEKIDYKINPDFQPFLP